MEGPKELYHEEVKKLKDFRSRLDTHAIYKQDLEEFSDDYEELVAQAKVITRVSDRLQKKLDNANLQIREQNEQIKEKNVQLGETIDQLVQARVGRKAATIMLTVAIALFIMEQILLEPVIDNYIANLNREAIPPIFHPFLPYLGLVILGVLFFIVKFLESTLESFFMNQEKKKIVKQEKKEEELKAAMAE